MDKQRWRERARCKALTPQQADDLFFYGPGKSSHKAKAFCAECPVHKECVDYSILYGEVGAWGGMPDTERNSIAPLLRPSLYSQAVANGTWEDHDVSNYIAIPTEQPPFRLDLPA